MNLAALIKLHQQQEISFDVEVAPGQLEQLCPHPELLFKSMSQRWIGLDIECACCQKAIFIPATTLVERGEGCVPKIVGEVFGQQWELKLRVDYQ